MGEMRWAVPEQACDCIDDPFGAIIPAPDPAAGAVLAAEHPAAVVGGDVVVADHCADQSEHDAAVGVSVEPLRQHADGRLDEALLEVLAVGVDLQHLVHRVHQWELQVVGGRGGHRQLLVLLDAAPQLDHLLAAELVDVLRRLVEGQQVVASGHHALYQVGEDQRRLHHELVGSDELHLF
jgi:hypothetical protein